MTMYMGKIMYIYITCQVIVKAWLLLNVYYISNCITRKVYNNSCSSLAMHFVCIQSLWIHMY